MTATATATSPKPQMVFHEEAKSIEEICDSMQESSHFNILMRTAATASWLCTGVLMTKLSKSEKKQCFDLMTKKYGISAAGEYFVPAKILDLKGKEGRQIGPMVTLCGSYPKQDDFPFLPPMIKMWTQWKDIAYLRTWHYLTLKQRHPQAIFHMTGWFKAEEKPIILTEGVAKTAVAMVMPLNVR